MTKKYTYNNLMKEAIKLVNRLESKVKRNPSALTENYGQKEVRKFKDTMSDAMYKQGLNLSYDQQRSLWDIVERVDEISI